MKSIIMYVKNTFGPLSWSKINLFLNCQRCFYKDQKLGVKRPGPAAENFKLNKAVDTLLKNEFNEYRQQQKAHPIMIENGVVAVPFAHDSLETWQDPYRAGGIRFYDSAMNMTLFGGVDDLWMNEAGELIVVEYKATATTDPITLDKRNQFHREYMRQISFYAWLFKKNKYNICPTSYFIFCNGITGNSSFNKRLEFDCTLLHYDIDDSWVEQTMQDVLRCLGQEYLPCAAIGCQYCNYEFKSKV